MKMMYSLIDIHTGEPKKRLLGLFHCQPITTSQEGPNMFGQGWEHVEDRLRHGIVPVWYMSAFGHLVTMKIGRLRPCTGSK